MNKRQRKKFAKKIKMFSSLEFVNDRCKICENYESGDYSVGLEQGCETEWLYDENDNIIDSRNDKIIEYMNCSGYGCPHFRCVANPKFKANLPKSYREYKQKMTAEKRLFSILTNL